MIYDPSDTGFQNRRMLEKIASALERSVEDFFGETAESVAVLQRIELLQIWDRIQTDAIRQAVLTGVRGAAHDML